MAQFTESNFFDQISAAFKAGDPLVEAKQHEAAQVRCIRLLFHAIVRGEFAEALELTTEDFTLEILGPENSPMVGRWVGRDEVLAAMQRNFKLVEDQRPAVQTVTAQGDSVIIIAREQGRVCATGKPYELTWVQEFTFDDGKIRQMREIFGGTEDFAS